ncbi:glycosyltransferase family 2 protein [Sphingomonas fennica]|uniref:Glycoside hydrolase family 2 n=1 Tax=Edaphosphingomonas fennica TaxID=114404 RepID=A0A2T4I641_9SPHN|nr:glycosyltransferase family 2 protein [Sphingomonas fennica]PTD26110.1 glycoside hydrolase family 2 [Sphingomonas fennica]
MSEAERPPHAAARVAPHVAIVIVNYRTPDLALRCVETLAAERVALPGLEVVVADGGSGDGSAEKLAAGLADPRFQGWARLLPLPINGGFGWANNQAMLRLLQQDDPPDYIHLLNPDTEIAPGAVALLAQWLAAHPRHAAVGSQLFRPDGATVGSAFRFPSIGREFLRGSATPALGRAFGIRPTLVEDAGDPDWVTGASVMLRAEALREVGLFDDGFFLYFEEVELMRRLRAAGWGVAHEPQSRVFHVGGAATGVNVANVARRPAYWFNSRRRYFVRTGGTATLVAATLAWMAGRALWKLREALRLTRGQPAAAPEATDHLRLSLAPRPGDRRPTVARWNDPPDQPPAWMETAR